MTTDVKAMLINVVTIIENFLSKNLEKQWVNMSNFLAFIVNN